MTTTLQNHSPRIDRAGGVIDCHDGCLRYFDGRFHLYGTRYGQTDGFTFANRYVCYSSDDLTHWTDHGELISSAPPGVYYRPYVVFNPRTRKYVLWYNWYHALWEGQFGCAVSDVPQGPFAIVNPRVPLRGKRPGDHNLFVDDDGTGYIVYTDIDGMGIDRHAMSVERLTPDFTASTREGSEVLDRRVEAPAMFKRAGLYYVVFGQTCCFCPEGADARVFVSSAPLGPYRFVGDINRDEFGQIIVPGQQTDICTLPTSSGSVHLWMADLWGSRRDGIKGHDIQFWSEPLQFRPDGSIKPLRWVDAFQLDLATGESTPCPLHRPSASACSESALTPIGRSSQA